METHLKFASFLAQILDNQFRIGGIKFGFSALVDLIPGFGDIIDAFLSLYVIWIALQVHVPYNILVQMISNIAVVFFLGLIPVIGDVGYIFYKPNLKNLKLIKDYLNSPVIDGEIMNAN